MEDKLPVEYTVTSELETSWWLKLLRFFRIKNKREDFTILLTYDFFQENLLHLALQSGEEKKKGEKDLKKQENKFTSNF